ncbi:MAG: hypothetical protein GKR77_01635 [Legionellales bacterium]|nr:hypothetical protein [Legionellales bacterium]
MPQTMSMMQVPLFPYQWFKKIYHAALQGDDDLLAGLQSRGIPMDMPVDNITPAERLAEQGFFEAVERLLHYGAGAELPIFRAARHNQATVPIELLMGENPQRIDAARAGYLVSGNIELAKKLYPLHQTIHTIFAATFIGAQRVFDILLDFDDERKFDAALRGAVAAGNPSLVYELLDAYCLHHNLFLSSNHINKITEYYAQYGHTFLLTNNTVRINAALGYFTSGRLTEFVDCSVGNPSLAQEIFKAIKKRIAQSPDHGLKLQILYNSLAHPFFIFRWLSASVQCGKLKKMSNLLVKHQLLTEDPEEKEWYQTNSRTFAQVMQRYSGMCLDQASIFEASQFLVISHAILPEGIAQIIASYLIVTHAVESTDIALSQKNMMLCRQLNYSAMLIDQWLASETNSLPERMTDLLDTARLLDQASWKCYGFFSDKKTYQKVRKLCATASQNSVEAFATQLAAIPGISSTSWLAVCLTFCYEQLAAEQIQCKKHNPR